MLFVQSEIQLVILTKLYNNLQYRIEMKKLKRLQYGDFLIKGKNLKEVMIENKIYKRYINHLGRLSKNALPF